MHIQSFPRKIFIGFLAALFSFLAIQSCQETYYFRNTYEEANGLIHEPRNLEEKPFLKAHTQNGDVFIFKDQWKLDTVKNEVIGNGTHYDFNRTQITDGILSVSMDSVVLFETNTPLKETEKTRIAQLGILAAADVALGLYCLANPKACFGSCPTFYMDPSHSFHYADAEGFSNAILPSLEYGDVDALSNEKIVDSRFSLYMKNEALETHCLNEITLLASPRAEGERVYQSRTDKFYRCRNLYQASEATAGEGDVTDLLAHKDREERYSLADAGNLKSKEEILLTFNNVDDMQDLGVVISYRQTLMTTYFIYSAMGYMGDEVADIFAKLEREGDLKKRLDNGFQKELGDLEVHVWNAETGEWEKQGSFYETGPIAFNQQILPLDNKQPTGELRLKLVMNKGLWRIDQVALTHILEEVQPLRISPDSIWKGAQPDLSAGVKLQNPEKYLISMPGDEYRFDFKLPKTSDYELFLYSKGYYLEWMRQDWFKDKNLMKLHQMFELPAAYLRSEAESYKEYEATMEDQFWGSRIDTKTFSYEN